MLRNVRLFALAACAVLSLSACNGIGSAPVPRPLPSGDVQATQVQSIALQTGITAEVAFNTAVTTFRAAEGSLPAATVTHGEALAKQGYMLLQPIRAAVRAGVNPDVASLTNLTMQLLALAPVAAKP